MTNPQLLNARIGELQLDLERQFEAGLAEPDPATASELDELLAAMDKWTCKTTCRRCGRPVIACPDPACCYHHGGEDGRFIYPPDCPGDLDIGDVNRDWRLL